MGFRNSKTQGDFGVGVSIGYFLSKGIGVSLPIGDSHDYDLIIDSCGSLGRVQVKTTTYKTKSGKYSVSMTVKGGNKSGTGKIKSFDKSKVEWVFVVTPIGNYLLPSSICQNHITFCSKYDKYALAAKTVSSVGL